MVSTSRPYSQFGHNVLAIDQYICVLLLFPMHPISSENNARRFSNTMHSKLLLHNTKLCKYQHAHSMQRICFIPIKSNLRAFYIIDLQAFLNYICDYHCGICEGLYNQYDLHIVICEVSEYYTMWLVRFEKNWLYYIHHRPTHYEDHLVGAPHFPIYYFIHKNTLDEGKTDFDHFA